MGNMLTGFIIAWSLAAILACYAQWKKPEVHRPALKKSWQTTKMLIVRMPIIIIAISLLITLVPQDFIAEKLGVSAGMEGIFYGSILGAFLPGGPSIAFPVVVVLIKAGATGGPLIALITSWTVLAIHRLVLFEIPFMGIKFALLRLASSLILPPIAGILGGLLLS